MISFRDASVARRKVPTRSDEEDSQLTDRDHGERHAGGQGSKALLESIYRSYSADVTSYALRRCSRDDSADVVSETFMVVWRRIDDVPDEPAVRPWLLGIARRVLANQRRGFRRRGALVDRVSSYLVPHLQIVPAVDIDGDAEMVMEAMELISTSDQEVLMLAAWEELNSNEIATVLGTSSSNARKRLFRARERLTAEVARMEMEQPSESGHLLPRGAESRLRRTEDVKSP